MNDIKHNSVLSWFGLFAIDLVLHISFVLKVVQFETFWSENTFFPLKQKLL